MTTYKEITDIQGHKWKLGEKVSIPIRHGPRSGKILHGTIQDFYSVHLILVRIREDGELHIICPTWMERKVKT